LCRQIAWEQAPGVPLEAPPPQLCLQPRALAHIRLRLSPRKRAINSRMIVTCLPLRDRAPSQARLSLHAASRAPLPTPAPGRQRFPCLCSRMCESRPQGPIPAGALPCTTPCLGLSKVQKASCLRLFPCFTKCCRRRATAHTSTCLSSAAHGPKASSV